MNAAILQRADHLQAGAIADVRKAFPSVTAEGALQNASVLRSIEHRTPLLELPHTIGCFLRVELGHPPMVEELAAFHRVAKMRLPVVLRIDMR